MFNSFTKSVPTLLALLLVLLCSQLCDAFAGNGGGVSTQSYAKMMMTIASSSTPLSALTERQMQFWEDVEDGLDDIENFYAKKGQSIDRIRQFGKR